MISAKNHFRRRHQLLFWFLTWIHPFEWPVIRKRRGLEPILLEASHSCTQYEVMLLPSTERIVQILRGKKNPDVLNKCECILPREIFSWFYPRILGEWFKVLDYNFHPLSLQLLSFATSINLLTRFPEASNFHKLSSKINSKTYRVATAKARFITASSVTL